MIPFMFEVLIGVIVLGLLFYMVRWAVTALGLPRPILVIVTVLFVLVFLYWAWGALPPHLYHAR
jgi:hypothetical protein